MRTEIQQKILAEARRRFNEEGYDRVSMRAIADGCGIAVGNLTYHFHKKEDLVRALMDDSFRETMPEAPIERLADVQEQFERMLSTVEQNAFYFLDDAFLGDQTGHNRQIRERLSRGLAHLTEQGVFSDEFDEAARQDILELLLLTHMTWLRGTVRGHRAMTREAFLRLHWRALLPYLTEEGKRQYQNEIEASS